MARQVPRFEASDDLFRRALAASQVLAREEEKAGAAPLQRDWRRLRIDRLESRELPDGFAMPRATTAIAPEAVPAAAPAEAPAAPEAPPEPAELQAALSEAEIPPADWAMVEDLAGGTPVARCLRPLLEMLEWNGAARQVAEALPHGGGPLDSFGATALLRRLGFAGRRLQVRLNQLGPDDFPCLFLTRDGRALVLGSFDVRAIPAFDSGTRLRRPQPRDRMPGTAIVFRPVEATSEAAIATTPLSLIWRHLKPRAGTLAALFACRHLFALAAPVLLFIAVDHAIPAASLPMLLFFAGAAGFAFLLEAMVARFADGLLARRSTDLPGNLRALAFARLLALPPSLLRGASPGWRRARAEDLDGGDGAEAQDFLAALSDAAFILAGLIAVAVMAGPLVLAPLAAIAVIAAVGAALRPALRARTAAARADRAWARAAWTDMAAARAAVLTAGCRETAVRRLARLSGRAIGAASEAATACLRSHAVGTGIAGAGIAATALAGCHLAAAGTITPGGLIGALLLTAWMLAGADRLLAAEGAAARLWVGLDQMRRLDGLADERPLDAPSAAPRHLTGRVSVSGLMTAEGAAIEAALDGIDLEAAPGEVIAVVGDCQSGKSALLQVLAGLLPPKAGQVRLDGVELPRFDPVQLRQSVAYVPEAPQFLPLTIEENLRLMDPVATEADLQRACALAGVMEDIRVMETGMGAARRFAMNVSMADMDREPHPGFFKRLALARGYLRRTGLYLLDGPERYLDPEGEQALLRAVEALRGGATVIIATDRPPLIRLADKVLWLDGGRVQAAGDAEEVLARLYAEGRVGQTLAAT